ncbi:MAG: hypothetical protein AB1714_02440 [Acidobacteriota bacterium]
MGARAVVHGCPTVDRDKLRAAIRKMGDEYVFYMLQDAIDLLPPTKLLKLVKKYIDPEKLQPAGEPKRDLLAGVNAFQKASLAREYYESFNVNSRNYREMSTATRAWIAECHRLLDRCIAMVKTGAPAEVRHAFDIIFELLDRIDDYREEIIFFADEAGSWQVCVDWERVLPAWFKVLSATAEPEEYARRIAGLLEHHYSYGRQKMLDVARKIATPEQRNALPT